MGCIIIEINTQIKSKLRITNHGEVFTASREVNDMLDLVKIETERIDSRFLEPACGTGNFLVEILKRKLAVVEKKYKRNQLEYESYAVLAVTSIYGIDLLADNVEECRYRLYIIFKENYIRLFNEDCKKNCKNSIKFILNYNITQGDALTLQTANDPIIFPEWTFVNLTTVKRRDYSFQSLLKQQDIKELSLFTEYGSDVYIPEPVKEHPLMHFLQIGSND